MLRCSYDFIFKTINYGCLRKWRASRKQQHESLDDKCDIVASAASIAIIFILSHPGASFLFPLFSSPVCADQ